MKIAPDGEILVRGENVTRGYFNADEETARAFEDGWFHTGDIGEIADDGQLYIRGRKKEMIVTPEGLNVFPEDVERVLKQIAGVRDAAVVGVPIGTEERVHAVARPRSGAPTDSDAIVRQANAELDDHQKIRRARRLAGTRAAAHRRHAQAEARGDSRLGEERRRAAAARGGGHRRARGAGLRSTPGATICRRRRRSKSSG